ncbi:MAG: GIY-YIG nuclease family protein [Cetobacterium sp.]
MKIIDLRTTDLRVKNNVYCIENSFGYVKIGKSRNLERRYKSISSTGGVKLNKKFSVESCGSLEREAHEHFKDKKYVGEWFDIDFEEAVEFLTKNAKEEVFEIYTQTIEEEALENLRKDLEIGRVDFFSKKIWFNCILEKGYLHEILEKINRNLASLSKEEFGEVDLDFVFDDYMMVEEKINRKELEFMKAMMDHNGIALEIFENNKDVREALNKKYKNILLESKVKLED